MASARIRLDPQTVEAIARRVVELLSYRRAAETELVDAAELAQRLGVDRCWVYAHAIELGAIKLSDGRRPRLRFDPRAAVERIRSASNTSNAPPAKPDRRSEPLSSARERPRLLPIKGGKS